MNELTFDVLIEIPAGSRNKYEVDKKSGKIRLDRRDIHHISEYDRLEIQHFFEVYKDLEPGKSVEGATWVGRVEAEREIQNSFDRYNSGETK
ncbi:MAG: hypothetical protein EBY00_03285 [Actinobacteria bacterium]|nr:hypothetical protein [Actinomycetota bacterium]